MGRNVVRKEVKNVLRLLTENLKERHYSRANDVNGKIQCNELNK